MDAALIESTHEALSTDWILDCDATIKLLYGHQDGAEIGYNPSKPGRPSHTIPTYWVANVRLVLDAEVQGGKAHAAKHSLPGLMRRMRSGNPSVISSKNLQTSCFRNQRGIRNANGSTANAALPGAGD